MDGHSDFPSSWQSYSLSNFDNAGVRLPSDAFLDTYNTEIRLSRRMDGEYANCL